MSDVWWGMATQASDSRPLSLPVERVPAKGASARAGPSPAWGVPAASALRQPVSSQPPCSPSQVRVWPAPSCPLQASCGETAALSLGGFVPASGSQPPLGLAAQRGVCVGPRPRPASTVPQPPDSGPLLQRCFRPPPIPHPWAEGPCPSRSFPQVPFSWPAGSTGPLPNPGKYHGPLLDAGHFSLACAYVPFHLSLCRGGSQPSFSSSEPPGGVDAQRSFDAERSGVALGVPRHSRAPVASGLWAGGCRAPDGTQVLLYAPGLTVGLGQPWTENRQQGWGSALR